MTPEAGKYYWVRFYRDDAEWEPAKLDWVSTDGCQHWQRIYSQEEWYDTEINQVGPEVIAPAEDWEVVE